MAYSPSPKMRNSTGLNQMPEAPGPRGTPRGLSELLRVGRPLPVPMNGPSAPLGSGSGTSSFMLHAGRNFATGGQVGPGGMNMSQGPQPGVATGQKLGGDALQAELERFTRQNPEAVAKVQDALSQAIQMGTITIEDINMVVQMAVSAAQNPEMYPRLRQMAIQKGFATEEELPQQYDEGLIFTILLAGAAIQGGLGNAETAPIADPASAGLQLGAPGGGGGAPQANGPVPNYAAGGEIPNRAGDRAGVKDGVTINVSEGEYVIPAEVVHRKGTEFFDRLIGKDVKAAK